jgi:NB-ARC domain
MRGRRSLLPGLLAGLLALLGILIAIPVNVVSGYFPAAVTSHRPVWIGLLAALLAVIVVLTWLASRAADRKPGPWLSMVPAVPGWVDRGELAEVVSALTAAGSGPVALTTGLVGAGGFGKTTLAAKACQDRKVRRHFRGGVVWITVGRDTDGPGLAARISEVIATADGDSGPAFTSPEQAGQALAGVLAGRGRTLLVVDDVWTAAQLQPFAAAGQPCRLLVTTRRPMVLDDVAARRIKVDAMPDPVARQLLTRDLEGMAGERPCRADQRSPSDPPARWTGRTGVVAAAGDTRLRLPVGVPHLPPTGRRPERRAGRGVL